MKHQELFNYLSNEHGVTLLENELQEVVKIVEREKRHEIIILGIKIDLSHVTDIHDVERDKTMFLNREAGFVIRFMDETKKVFKEDIPYETYTSEKNEIKSRWYKLEKEITAKWKEVKHQLPEFNWETIKGSKK